MAQLAKQAGPYLLLQTSVVQLTTIFGILSISIESLHQHERADQG
jgi:hypothetical protein